MQSEESLNKNKKTKLDVIANYAVPLITFCMRLSRKWVINCIVERHKEWFDLIVELIKSWM